MTSTPASKKRSLPTTALGKLCEQCGTEFRAMPSELARRRYCSQDCVGASRRGKRKTEWVNLRCAVCQVEFQVTPAWFRTGRRRYCSADCRTQAHPPASRTGISHTEQSRRKMADAATGKFLRENSSQWKGGRYLDRAGYRHVMVDMLRPETQALVRQTTRQKYVGEHRAVAMETLARPLGGDEVVHHRNGEKADNRPENLMVTPRASHSIEHRRIEREFRAMQDEVARLRSENAALRSATT